MLPIDPPLSLVRCLMPGSPAASRECRLATEAHKSGKPQAVRPAAGPVVVPASAGNAATAHAMHAAPATVPLLLTGQNQAGNAAVAGAAWAVPPPAAPLAVTPLKPKDAPPA
ncbi:hypothetical protein Skr01_69510 [Sphaerisporangium krabiense]|uniref:Uncharacterized protein n=1 Tax=Sphaerisporangium krabiense TaxID=763782 RepID=A0A7W8Z6Z7_9ACTN|nr:hypothetical protein [Sphaerisporangium krabiense]MBB5628395.1 hypothetical protein [Sphaerisporangium krabiense]GII66866.1 hypothetical protein Skr01_69510 [Sphaerisporangium krabiense]